MFTGCYKLGGAKRKKKSMETKPKLQWDKINSTWWWEIELDHSHARNYNRNVQMITGYSKAQGHDEAKDKIQMLMRKILMLATNGYFERCKYIIIYKRAGQLVDKKRDKIMFTLFSKDYKLPAENIGQTPELVTFLTKLYDHIREGKEIKYLLPKPKAEFSKDDYFRIERHSFPSKIHLYHWAEKMIKDGHSFLQVQSFVVKYIERFFSGPDPKPLMSSLKRKSNN